MAVNEGNSGVRVRPIFLVVAIVGGLMWGLYRPNKHSEAQTTTKTIQQVGGALTVETTTLPDTPQQKIQEFDAISQEWLKKQLAQARLIIARYSHDPAPDPFDPVNLDEVFKRWLNDTAADAPKDSAIPDALGAALGDYLCRHLAMRWVVVTDENGTAKAVRHETSQTMGFPVDSVAKRVESKEVDFFDKIAQTYELQINNKL